MARVAVPVTELKGVRASYTTAMAGSNNDLVFTARRAGPGGNSIQIVFVDPGADAELAVDVDGFVITVNLGYSSGAIDSTAAAVRNALEGTTDAKKLIDTTFSGADTGAGLVTAFSIQSLAGGAFELTPPAETNGDATNGHLITGNAGLDHIEVRNNGVSSRTLTLYYAASALVGVTIANVSITVPAGETRRVCDLAPNLFNQNDEGDVYFDVSHADLKLRAYRGVQAA
jgi:hypothetical protein